MVDTMTDGGDAGAEIVQPAEAADISRWHEEGSAEAIFRTRPNGCPRRRTFFTSLLIALTLGLSGCASWFPTEQGYRHVLDTWIGSTGEQLVAKWGVPDGEHTSPSGTKIYQYKGRRSYTVSGGTRSEQVKIDGNYVWVDVPQPDETQTTWCDTTFHINADDIIESYYFKGPDCTAYEK